MIREYTRVARVLEAFDDHGRFGNDLSRSYETIALAYANKEAYDACLAYLEKAADAAVLYDKQSGDLLYDPNVTMYDLPDDTMEVTEKVSACKSMLAALGSNERSAYDSIRDSERFRKVTEKLTKAANG